ncbi:MULTISPECIES: transglycosylase SLT domain-containing protein [Aphanothece]|uniref:transglycosylase SLT domain-containing protein n=1 Tax=Aphanothece TaxID=1121 RepID=UPI0039856207
MALLLRPLGRPLTLLLLTGLGLLGAAIPSRVLANETPRANALAAIRQVWPEEHIDSAIRLAHLESGLSPTARGCAGDCFGLFQIHYIANRRLMAAMGIHSPEQLLDPIVNSTVAYRIFRESGWGPWGVEP